MEQHVRDDLSAYLDGALSTAERALVQGHLDGCAACRAAFAELRATARVIAVLPLPAPSRRLVPSLAPRFAWLRPLRSLSAVLSGVLILVFMASATLDTGWRMGGGRAARTTGLATQNAPAAAPAGQATPVAGATGAARAPVIVAPSPGATTSSAERAAEAQRTASPGARQDGLRGAPAGDAAEAGRAATEPLRVGPSPWLWLGLALLCGALALAAHRRLRAR